MKKVILVCVIILVGAGVYLYTKDTNQPSKIYPSPLPSQSPSNGIQFCLPQNLHATVTFDHAAGNVYGIFTIENISSTTCQIRGNNFIETTVDAKTNNISLAHVGGVEARIFSLSPNQTIYSQVHYPNGPQCGSGIQPAKVTFTYAISPSNTVTFADQEGNNKQDVTTCVSPSEITTIELWNMSSKPITP